jgi:uncharacterized protein YndB with AHSA1/START domain
LWRFSRPERGSAAVVQETVFGLWLDRRDPCEDPLEELMVTALFPLPYHATWGLHMNESPTDRIEKTIVLRASRARVWRALADAVEFGSWFGVVLDGPFIPGGTVSGKITHKGYEHLKWEITVERMEKERLFSFRWHPYAIEPSVDYSREPTTLIVFTLEDEEGGTRLRVVESGFDAIPLARRALAFRMNDQGWAVQMTSIENHVQLS